MKKIMLMCLALIGCHADEFVFKDVSAISVLKEGKTHELDISKKSNLADIMNQITLVDEQKANEKTPLLSWDYKLLITKKNDTNLWLYSSKTGHIKVLAMNKTPLYKLNEFHTFNKILKMTQ